MRVVLAGVSPLLRERIARQLAEAGLEVVDQAADAADHRPVLAALDFSSR